jgi:hypothetical protein
MGLRAKRVILTTSLTSAAEVIEEHVRESYIQWRDARDARRWHFELLSAEIRKADWLFRPQHSRLPLNKPQLVQALHEAYKAIILGIEPTQYGKYIGETAPITEESYVGIASFLKNTQDVVE